MSNSGSLGTATAEPATMNRVSLGHEETLDSKGERQEERFTVLHTLKKEAEYSSETSLSTHKIT
jgi:hypothetical protein